MSKQLCWVCNSDDIVYVDVLTCPWCAKCYETIYLEGR